MLYLSCCISFLTLYQEIQVRYIDTEQITKRVKEAVVRANVELDDNMISALKDALNREESEIGREVIHELIKNAEIARREGIPMCQDTGIATIFVRIGQEVSITGGNLYDALEEGVRQGYNEGYLRKSVCHPLTRENTKDNTPPIIHTDIVSGDVLTIWIMPKGGGAENVSRLYMLNPTESWGVIKEKIIETIKEAGGKACPPLIIGVGIGGNFETAPLLAKKSLLRSVGSKNSDPDLADMEMELLKEINKLGIGPQGLGGRITALAVHINMMPCHIASLPVAINIQCNANRSIKIDL
ncbi:MAG: fumarate hydratase [Deltaproteobacteria bacterium]|nr:MAG: fumarate hydratase [Deltaproteobacteria bacterium]